MKCNLNLSKSSESVCVCICTAATVWTNPLIAIIMKKEWKIKRCTRDEWHCCCSSSCPDSRGFYLVALVAMLETELNEWTQNEFQNAEWQNINWGRMLSCAATVFSFPLHCQFPAELLLLPIQSVHLQFNQSSVCLPQLQLVTMVGTEWLNEWQQSLRWSHSCWKTAITISVEILCGI